MNDHDPRTKRIPKELWLYQNCTDDKYGALSQERQILEMIDLGAPLPSTINRLCSIIDVQIGDVVSVVSLADEERIHFCAKARTAMEVGLTLFSSTDILSRSKGLLGTLEIYGCDPRLPTSYESQVIQKVARLVAVALQRHKDTQELERRSKKSAGSSDNDEIQKPPFIN